MKPQYDNRKLTDDEVLALMRRVIIGREPAARICRQNNINPKSFAKWVQGINRANLRTQIDRELAARNT